MKSFLFKEPLFNQILAGNKTQTRRTILFKNPHKKIELTDSDANNTTLWFKHPNGTYERINAPKRVGEICYLKEPYCQKVDYKGNKLEDYYYKFDYPVYKDENGRDISAVERRFLGYKNKLFMPEKTARYFMKIIDVRIERLQDISDKDAIAEGIELGGGFDGQNIYSAYQFKCTTSLPKLSFKGLWESIHKKINTWEDNPYLWVYDFKLIDKSEAYQ